MLHLGNLRTALVCWLQARLAGGQLILRMDDLDRARVKIGSAIQIRGDLAWLGLNHDGKIIVQSERAALYQAAFEQLQQQRQVFPCSCSRRDIQLALSAPDGGASDAVYPGTCRPPANANGNDIGNTENQPLAWRFLAGDDDLVYSDQVLGSRQANLAAWPGDFVVRRKDGIVAYQLASVVDDGLLGVTDVVRGDDLADSSARQIALFNALGYPAPRFWHVPLMADENGNKLSKRDGSDSLQQIRAHNYSASKVIGLLAASLHLIPQEYALSAVELAGEIGSPQKLRQLLIAGSAA